MREVEAVVSGRVQGVGYRYFVRDEAARRGVTGWVQNNPDGTVSISAAGEEDILRGFLAAIRAEGDPYIRVAGISTAWHEKANTARGFEIRR